MTSIGSPRVPGSSSAAEAGAESGAEPPLPHDPWPGGDRYVPGAISRAAARRLARALRLTSSGDLSRDLERAIAGMFVITRASNIVTIAFGIPPALAAARFLPVHLTLTVAALAFLLAECVALWRSGRFTARPWGWVDFGVAIGALLVNSALLPASAQMGTWSVWAPGFAVASASGVGIWARTRRGAIGLSSVLGAVYLVVMLVWSDKSVWTIAANVATYPAFGLLVHWSTWHLRRLMREATAAREAAVAATARVELERYRLLVHDATGVLRLLGDEDTPEIMRRALRGQALAESARLRAYLSDGVPGAPGTAQEESAWTLGRAVAGAVQGFDDLPLELAVDLAADTVLGEIDALVLQRALVTVLHNVRRHAHATHVVVHADRRGQAWELSVRDDGVGFDPSDRPPGFGLATQVGAEVLRRGMSATVESAPGEGTAVTFVGAQTPRERG